MELRYSPHAVDRMIQRQISTAEVEDVLAKPDGLIKQSQDKVIFYKKINTRTDNALAVVAVEQDGNFEVVTVMVNFEVKK
jgi:hypothetical protein